MDTPALGIAAWTKTLEGGAARHASRGPAERARLALDCAASVCRVVDAWAEAACGIKYGGLEAEETATGPLVTLRLLLLTARALRDVARHGLPRIHAQPRMLHSAFGGATRIAVDVVPSIGLYDGLVFPGHRATVRCVDPGGVESFQRSWLREVDERPRSGGVSCVLGAGNVTGLAAADAITQIFEYGRAVMLKLHPLHAVLEPVLGEALRPLMDAGLLRIVTGGTDVAQAVIQSPGVTHVHFTGGKAAFDAIVWGVGTTPAANARPSLSKPITCELGNVTPWIIVPGRYTRQELASQADLVAGSIINNTSFNCIATKLVITCRQWPQREEFLSLVERRLGNAPARPCWYPGAASAWEVITGRSLPADGTMPWIFRTGLDPQREPEWLDREWFVPVVAETSVAADGIDSFCGMAGGIVHSLPGSLAASVTMPRLSADDKQRVDLLVDHLPFGVVAVNTWSALAYSLATVPWGGLPGATLAAPRSGIGHVHDPLLLPLVHNTILTAPAVLSPPPPWLPWQPQAASLTKGLTAMYGAIARGGVGLLPLLRMLPDVIRATLRPPLP